MCFIYLFRTILLVKVRVLSASELTIFPTIIFMLPSSILPMPNFNIVIFRRFKKGGAIHQENFIFAVLSALKVNGSNVK